MLKVRIRSQYSKPGRSHHVDLEGETGRTPCHSSTPRDEPDTETNVMLFRCCKTYVAASARPTSGVCASGALLGKGTAWAAPPMVAGAGGGEEG